MQGASVSQEALLLLDDRRDGVAVLQLNRPAVLNAMTTDLLDELEAAFSSVATDEKVKAVVLTGSGRGFCSGEDLNAAASETPESMSDFVDRLQILTRRMLDVDKPIIAAVNGPAIGGGAELALACDLRLASESAFFRFPEAGLGIICTGGTLFLLSEVVGRGRAVELLMTGRTLAAEEALSVGFLAEAHDEDELLGRAVDLASRLGSIPDPAMRELKQGLRLLDRAMLDQAIEFERAAAARLYRRADSRENATQFVNRDR